MKRLCILGSTGSIGTQTIDIISRHQGYKVVSLAAKSSIDKLYEQIKALHPEKVCVYEDLKNFVQNESSSRLLILTKGLSLKENGVIRTKNIINHTF